MGKNDAGEIRVLGLDHRVSEVELKRRAAYVSPDLNFAVWGKVGKAIRFVRGFYPNWDDNYCAALMKEFHLSDTDKIATLSFGAKTKLSLLLALSRRPEILILDEPTTGLDAVSKQQVFSELLKAVEDGERTVLISSHGLTDVERFADHIGMIKNGKLLLEGFISWRSPAPSHHSTKPFFVNLWQFWWVMMFQIIIVSTHLRFLRTLPFSAWKLSAVLVFAPFIGMLAITFLIMIFTPAIAGFAPVSPMEMFRQGYFLQISLATVFAPLIMWRGYGIAVTTWRMRDILIFLLLLGGMVACILGYGFMKNHLSISGTVSLLVVLGSFFVTKLILERSSRTYRPSTIQFSSWGWRRRKIIPVAASPKISTAPCGGH